MEHHEIKRAIEAEAHETHADEYAVDCPLCDAEQRNREIADGYLEAALFTAGVDGGPGEYHADPDKIAALAVFGASGVANWIGRMGAEGIAELESLGLDLRRIGNCVHYEREGHGCGFEDDGDAPVFTLAAKAAREQGEDYALQDALMRFEDAFTD